MWSNASYTRFERPKELTSLAITEAEARAFAQKWAKYGGVPPPPDDTVGQADSEFPESGTDFSHIKGEIRSSWIVEPADGKIPYNQETIKRLHLDEHPRPDHFDNVEERPAAERCLTSAGSSPPLLPAFDASVFQFVQTADAVVILSEKHHDVRIIRLNGSAPPPAAPSWSGNSVGRWEGDTLVVETSGYRPGLIERGNRVFFSSQTTVVERFTRIAPDTILYAFSVTDPSLYTQTWRGEGLFNASKGPLFEYACHEGNYAIVNILTAARLGRQDRPAPAVVTAKAGP